MKTDLKVKAKGIVYPVFLDDDGMFTATVAKQKISAPSLSRLSELAGKAARGADKLSILFTNYSRQSGHHAAGTLTGVHATQHRTVLVRWDGTGLAGPVPLSQMGYTMQRLSPAEISRLDVLSARAISANQDLDQFLIEHRLDLWHAAQATATEKETEAAQS